MDRELREYVMRIFNFHPEEEFTSFQEIINAGRTTRPHSSYCIAALLLVEVLARHIDVLEANDT